MEHNYMERQVKLQTAMRSQGIDGYVVTQNVDLYYLTGSMQTGYLFIPAEGDPVYLVRRSIARAETESASQVEPLGSLKTLQARLAERYGRQALTLATEFDVLPVVVFQRLESAFPGARWLDGSQLVRELRMRKAPSELEAIRRAARAVDAALESGLAHFHAGITEVALMAHIEHQLRLQGHTGLMRMRAYNAELVTGCLAAGPSAADPTYFDGPAGGRGLGPASPQGSSLRPIEAGEPILLDLGCTIDGYVIDQTRTAVLGALPDDLQQAYDAAEAVLRAAEAKLKPGTVCEELYLDALRQVEQLGLAAHFMGFGADQVKFLGHGIGLEIDELPVLAKGFSYPLEPGMVIAIEPKFTFPGRGVVGIENSYLITEDGYEKLTISREGLIRL